MKTLKKTLSLTLVFAMVFSLMSMAFAAPTATTTTKTTGYTDAASITYKEAVDVASAIGVFQGNDSKAFAPTDKLTREQAAKVICYLTMGKAAADKLTTASDPFTDVPAARWSAGSIAYCKQQSIIAGYGDGKFGPTDTVTGYQFSKMLLVALGYDATIEGFNGSDWQINVAKRAFSNKLSAGNDAFVGTSPATREEAALYVLNTLQAELVTYDSKGTNITLPDGTTVNTGASAPEQKANNTFMSNYYRGLDVRTGKDAQGRTANVWTLKGAEIGKYAAGADYTFTKAASGTTNAAKVASMGLTGFSIAGNSVVPVINNADGAPVTTLADLVALTGNGRLVEVNVNADKTTEITGITVVDFYLAQITAINTTAKTATVKTVNGTTILTNNDTNPKVYTTLSGMKVKDYVLISKAADNSAITSVALPTTAVGTVTKLTGTAPSVTGVTVAGTAYSLSNNNVDVKDLTAGVMTAKSNVTLYLDSYGYAIYVTDAAVSAQYMAVVKLTQTVTNGVLTTNAIGYTPAGTPVSLNLGALLANQLPTVGALYSYAPATASAPTGADYEIAPVSQLAKANAGSPQDGTFVAVNPSTGIQAGAITLPSGAGIAAETTPTTVAIPYASGVKFIFADKAAGTVTVKNGVQAIAAAAGLQAAALIVDVDGVKYISAVYVNGSAPDAAGSSILYLSKDTGSEYVGSTACNSYKAWIDGAEVSILTKANNSTNVGKFCNYAKDETTGIYTLKAASQDALAAASVNDGQALAAPTTGTESYVIKAGGVELNASNAVIINLTNKAIGSIGDINELVATANTTVNVALVYNNLASSTGYKTVSYIFVENVASSDTTVSKAAAAAKVTGIAGTKISAGAATYTMAEILADLVFPAGATYVLKDNGTAFTDTTTVVNNDNFTIVVTAADGSTTATYTIDVA